MSDIKIVVLSDNAGMTERVNKIIEQNDFSVSAELNWHYCCTAVDFYKRNKPGIVVFCVDTEMQYAEAASVLLALCQYSSVAQVLVIGSKHNPYLSEITLRSGAGWILSLDEEAHLIGIALKRMEASYLIRKKLLQRNFLDYVKHRNESDRYNTSFLCNEYAHETEFQVAVVHALPLFRRGHRLVENYYVIEKSRALLTHRLEGQDYLLTQDGNDHLILFIGGGANARVSLMKNYLRDVYNQNITISPIASWVSLGRTVSSIGDLPASYTVAKDHLAKRFLNGGETLFLNEEADGTRFDSEQRIQVFDTRKTLINCLETLDADTVSKTLHSLKKNLAGTTYFDFKDLFSAYNSLISTFFREMEVKEINVNDLSFDYDVLMKEYDLVWNIDELFGVIEDVYTEGIQLLKAREESALPTPIVLAKRYIRAYFNSPLTIKEVSEYVGMSEYHFSECFKKHMNMAFKQYQTDLRVRYAKQLLIDRNNDLERISNMVGYNDVKYFSKVFKQVTGQTPNSFRNTIHLHNDFAE